MRRLASLLLAPASVLAFVLGAAVSLPGCFCQCPSPRFIALSDGLSEIRQFFRHDGTSVGTLLIESDLMEVEYVDAGGASWLVTYELGEPTSYWED